MTKRVDTDESSCKARDSLTSPTVSGLSFDDLYAIAERRGLVLWTRSNRVERVTLARRSKRQRRGMILVKTLRSRRVLRYFTRDVHASRRFFCIEIAKTEKEAT